MKSLVEDVVTALRDGQVVLIPTDTVYGLAADPYSADATDRLFAIKRRPAAEPVAVLVANLDQARRIIEINEAFERFATRYWPGALTLVATQLHPGALYVGHHETLGVRQPADEFILRVTEAFGPIAASSANRHGQPVVIDDASARNEFAAEVDLIIDGGRRDVIASTVVDVSSGSPLILRQGVVFIPADTN